MPNCIFCGQSIDVKKNKPEHVLLSCLGGRMTTTSIICGECNERFGSGIDECLARAVEPLRNTFNLPSGTKKKPPTIGNIQCGSDKIDLLPGGVPQLRQSPFEILEEGSTTTFKVRCEPSRLPSVIDSISRKTGRSPEDIRRSMSELGAEIEVRPVDGFVRHSLELGGDEQIRSMVKMCLVFFAKMMERVSSFTMNDCADAIAFVNGGDGRKLDIVMDPRPYPCVVPEKYGRMFNSIVIAGDPNGKIYGYFKLMNGPGWRFLLCSMGGVADIYGYLVSNPQRPSIWGTHFSGLSVPDIQVSFEWLSAASPENFDRLSQEWLAKLLEEHQSASRQEYIGKMVADTLGELGINEGDKIPPEFWAVLSDKVAHYVVGIPYRTKVGAKELDKIMNGRGAST